MALNHEAFEQGPPLQAVAVQRNSEEPIHNLGPDKEIITRELRDPTVPNVVAQVWINQALRRRYRGWGFDLEETEPNRLQVIPRPPLPSINTQLLMELFQDFRIAQFKDEYRAPLRDKITALSKTNPTELRALVPALKTMQAIFDKSEIITLTDEELRRVW